MELDHPEFGINCLNTMGNKIVCCQETDFIPFKDLDLDQQKAIIEDELDQNQRS